ncbi:hypothetical protein yc1106_02980 [Curvularia clavata]|uniref:F-box domain-containing protein n=1 Tax=Curvularia clavata TaxID=95742 RepID=A0A9Q8Z4H3_CURCL|nr:hypothetical protein yc1106_02980 [Curvularia clavata]
MKDLPQELVDKICSYLRQEHLKKVLLLSRQFRYSAEKFSGFFKEYTVNENNIQEFVSRFSGRRLLYLKEVIFRPTLPPFPEHDEDAESIPCRETADEVRKRDEWFTKQIQWLFRTLSLIENWPENPVQGRYRLSIYSPTRKPENEWHCPHQMIVNWRVRLLKADLPLISSVQSFEIYNNYNHNGMPYYFWNGMNETSQSELKLDLRILVDLATRFPNLEYLGIRTGGFEWCEHSGQADDPIKQYECDWPGLQRDARNSFADALLSLYDQLPKSLRRACLDFLNPLSRAFEIAHSKPLPDLVGPLKHDAFSSSLRLLGSNLRRLQLRCMIDESIFSLDSTAIIWPNLEQFELMFHIVRPDGTWYFQGFDGRGHESVGFPVTNAHYPPYETTEADEDLDAELDNWRKVSPARTAIRFRIVPNHRLRPLLEGFGKAAMQMRYLKEAIIWCPLLCDDEDSWDHGGSNDGAWGIRYTDSGRWFTELGRSKSPDSGRRLEWWTLSWRPDPELHNLYRQIGCSRLGEGLEELWTDDLVKDSAVRLGLFEDGEFGDDPGCIHPL